MAKGGGGAYERPQDLLKGSMEGTGELDIRRQRTTGEKIEIRDQKTTIEYLATGGENR